MGANPRRESNPGQKFSAHHLAPEPPSKRYPPARAAPLDLHPLNKRTYRHSDLFEQCRMRTVSA